MIHGMPAHPTKIVIVCNPGSIPNQTNHEEYEVTFYHEHGYSVTFINVQQMNDLLYVLRKLQLTNVEVIYSMAINETRVPDFKRIPVMLTNFVSPYWALVHRTPSGMLLMMISLEGDYYAEVKPDTLTDKARKLFDI
jgi:hypothetical protein